MDKIDLKKKKVLVVEDEERNWFVLRDIIQFNNGEAIWAESGMAGIDIIKNDPEISLVFMDVRLPFMRGSEATRKIKAIRNDLPIIAQTAFSEKKEKDECFKAGCNDLIIKPLNFIQVANLMEKYLTEQN